MYVRQNDLLLLNIAHVYNKFTSMYTCVGTIILVVILVVIIAIVIIIVVPVAVVIVYFRSMYIIHVTCMH